MQSTIPSNNALLSLVSEQEDWDSMTTYVPPTDSSNIDTENYVDLYGLLAYPEYMEFQKYDPRTPDPLTEDDPVLKDYMSHSQSRESTDPRTIRERSPAAVATCQVSRGRSQTQRTERYTDHVSQATTRSHTVLELPRPRAIHPRHAITGEELSENSINYPRAPRQPSIPLPSQPGAPVRVATSVMNDMSTEESNESESIGSRDTSSDPGPRENSMSADSSYKDDMDPESASSDSTDTHSSMPELESVTGTSDSSDSSGPPKLHESHVPGIFPATDKLRRVANDLSKRIRHWVLSHPELTSDTGRLPPPESLQNRQTGLGEISMTSAPATPSSISELEKVCDPPCPICIYAREDSGPPQKTTEEEEVD
ncbi:hypothetical protein B0H11DRAFT_1936654 [Mycena galericulata]|nr:hypothetical protein B0H11DRAFT_1936654 [Mycena galericulata]